MPNVTVCEVIVTCAGGCKWCAWGCNLVHGITGRFKKLAMKTPSRLETFERKLLSALILSPELVENQENLGSVSRWTSTMINSPWEFSTDKKMARLNFPRE